MNGALTKHSSSYLGLYDIVQGEERFLVRSNFVEEEGEWDYPELTDYSTVVVVEETERPDEVISTVTNLGYASVIAENCEY